jgi:hypothetical protein
MMRRLGLSLMTLALFSIANMAPSWACDPNVTEYMSCNVPHWCGLRVGSFPYFGVQNECVCLQLCRDAQAQGEGSSCSILPDGMGRNWYSITFNKWDANNNFRGTVLCDPRDGGKNSNGRPGGRKLL